MDGINEAFAEYFSVELAAKVERGMTQNVIEGKFNGGRMPNGYKKDENGNDLVLEAKWIFTIEYNLDGGANDPENPTYYTKDMDDIPLNAPTKEDQHLNGFINKNDE